MKYYLPYILIFTGLFIIAACVTLAIYALPPKHVKEYYINSKTVSYIGVIPIIHIVIENGVDRNMWLKDYTFEEAITLCDSLNQSLK